MELHLPNSTVKLEWLAFQIIINCESYAFCTDLKRLWIGYSEKLNAILKPWPNPKSQKKSAEINAEIQVKWYRNISPPKYISSMSKVFALRSWFRHRQFKKNISAQTSQNGSQNYNILNLIYLDSWERPHTWDSFLQHLRVRNFTSCW